MEDWTSIWKQQRSVWGKDGGASCEAPEQEGWHHGLYGKGLQGHRWQEKWPRGGDCVVVLEDEIEGKEVQEEHGIEEQEQYKIDPRKKDQGTRWAQEENKSVRKKGPSPHRRKVNWGN